MSELVGAATLASVLVRDLRSGEERLLETTALFVLIGSTPHTTWLHGQIPLDEKGFVRSGSVKRVASAVGEGAIAVRHVHDFLGAAGRR